MNLQLLEDDIISSNDGCDRNDSLLTWIKK